MKWPRPVQGQQSQGAVQVTCKGSASRLEYTSVCKTCHVEHLSQGEDVVGVPRRLVVHLARQAFPSSKGSQLQLRSNAACHRS